VAVASLTAVVTLTVAASIPTLRDTRDEVEAHWLTSTYAAVAYPNSRWAQVWDDLRDTGAPVLAPPSDSAMAWFRSGRPALYVQRPGYVKLGFDAEQATGWSEAERRADVTSAFVRGAPALCQLASEREVSAVMLRQHDGRLGIIDFSGGAAADFGLLSNGSSVLDRNSHVVAIIPAAGQVDLRSIARSDVDVLSIWQALGDGSDRFELFAGRRALAPTAFAQDGYSDRLDFSIPSQRTPALRLVNTSTQPLWLVRAVGFSSAITSASDPANVLEVSDLCRVADD
jgi:hypothetical protein